MILKVTLRALLIFWEIGIFCLYYIKSNFELMGLVGFLIFLGFFYVWAVWEFGVWRFLKVF